MISLFKHSAVLKSSDCATHVPHVFTVPECGELVFKFSYSPKKLDDMAAAKEQIENSFKKYSGDEHRYGYPEWETYCPLLNLLTLSIDSPSEYRGCAHRQPNEQVHTLSKSYASPGFTKGAIEAGEWRAVVSVHALVSDECSYTLEVFAKGCGGK